ncbi:MAG: hypothetical protein VW405_05710, partial [Rhodospirillaceae bacterium]
MNCADQPTSFTGASTLAPLAAPGDIGFIAREWPPPDCPPPRLARPHAVVGPDLEQRPGGLTERLLARLGQLSDEGRELALRKVGVKLLAGDRAVAVVVEIGDQHLRRQRTQQERHRRGT